jgi:tetratricopeptide (TPR) repeat protein/tRNA A-37 threonylcarbamoyl transferase component Bud32
LQAALADRYAITRELGRGATATVYLAQDLKHKSLVALKVLAEEFALVVRTERFVGEIQMAARLTHPHILTLLDSGSAGGLLYYAMPYIDGGTLADRMARDGTLAVEEAVRLAREVADALDYAHAQRVIHRDIKPGNILLSAGHAWVADFGIARAIGADDTGMTGTGARLGTPAYMSPEQVTGDHPLDGRTDIYSLGCVLYEMLAGEAPFAGPSVQTVMARRVVDPAPSVRAIRPDVPEGLDDVLLVALARQPAERFATARDFGKALAQKGSGAFVAGKRAVVARPRQTARRALSVLVPVALTVAAVAVWGGLPRGRSPDLTRYLVLPIQGDGTAPAAQYGEAFLRDELSRWTGIKVIDRQRVRDALAERERGVLDSRAARDLAREFGAGRYIRTDVSLVGDSTRVHAALYDATGDSVLSERTINLGAGLVRADSTFAALVDRLLFNSSGAEPTGTHSFPARLAFERGRAAVQEWDLGKADSAFVAAADADPNFAQAHLWLAQVRFWNESEPATWRSPAQRAAAGKRRLSAHDAILSDALVAFGQGDVEHAWRTFDRLARREPYDFSAWYGLAVSLNHDDAVVRDAASPSGWRFRSSYYRAMRAYQRAFQLLPAIHRALSGTSYTAVRRVLITYGSSLRMGRALTPDTTSFGAYADWLHDTLALVPYPFAELKVAPAGLSVAVHRQREVFHDIATGWVTAFPHSPSALEALAISLQLLGDPAALDTLRRARAFVTTPAEAVRIAGEEVWMRVKFSVPSDLRGLRVARLLADSLLRGAPPPTAMEPAVLLSLAVLTGRAGLATVLARHPDVTAEWEVPGPLAKTVGPLLIFATLGGPMDSIRDLSSEVDSAIGANIVPPAQPEAQARWLGRPAALAFPVYRFPFLPKLLADAYGVLKAEAAFSRGDTGSVRRILADVRTARRFAAPSELTPDALFPEAWLLAQVGDLRAAIGWLDPTLGSLPLSAPQMLVDPANAGALVQAIALRAELASRVGDARGAARWASVVKVLWSDADSFLQPRLRDMEHYIRAAGER